MKSTKILIQGTLVWLAQLLLSDLLAISTVRPDFCLILIIYWSFQYNRSIEIISGFLILLILILVFIFFRSKPFLKKTLSRIYHQNNVMIFSNNNGEDFRVYLHLAYFLMLVLFGCILKNVYIY